MAAGLGFKTFAVGEVLSAANVNGYLMQGVLVFANATARDAAITSPQEGQCCYLKDSDATLTYNGSAWVGFDDSNAIQNSIVDAKGDLIAATANDIPARLAVGTNGQVLTADSTAATGLAWANASSGATSLGYSAGKNKIINSDFGIWQRGTSFTPSAAWNYNADRWTMYCAGSGHTPVVSRQTFTPATAPVAGYEGLYFWRYSQAAAGSGNTTNNVAQRIENVQTFAGQQVTVSFWGKADAARTVTSEFYQEFGSGGSAGVTTTGGSYSFTTSWQRFTTTVTVPSISGKTIGTNSYLTLQFILPTGVAQTIDFWGVQVENGSTATAFQTATGNIPSELAACQRYYNNLGTVGHVAYSSVGVMGFVYPVTMRATPTASFSYSGVANRFYNIQTGGTSDLVSPTVVVSNTGVANLYAFTPSNWAVSAGTGFHTQWTLEAEL